MSGVEEDLNVNDVAVDEINVGEEEADQAELEQMMEEKFSETLEKRDESAAPEETPSSVEP